jgi:hypothetical protein
MASPEQQLFSAKPIEISALSALLKRFIALNRRSFCRWRRGPVQKIHPKLQK